MKLLNRTSQKGFHSGGYPAKQYFSLYDDNGEIILFIQALKFARGKVRDGMIYLRTWKGCALFYQEYAIKVSSLEQAMNQLFDFRTKEEQK